jgi:glycosyltransferase involved in cell wall biosynthesis
MSLCIGIDDQIFASQDFGGISRYFYEVASKLSSKPNIDLNIVAPLYRNRYLREHLGSIKLSGAYCPGIPKTDRFRDFYNWSVSRCLMRRLKPNVVHETYYRVAGSAPRGIPTVTTVHDMIHELFPHWISRSDPTARRKAAALSRANHIICVSHSTKNDLVRFYGIPEEKVTVIYHGISVFSEDHEPNYRESLREPYLLYVGKRGSYKNFLRFIEAYSDSKVLSAEYKIICFGGGEFTAEERLHFKSLGISPANILHYSGGDRVLSRLYRHAALFVYPSLYEGFGMPPLEAMSTGCPVACSNVASLPEVVGDAAATFDPYDRESVRDAMETCIMDSQLREELSRRGHSRVLEFSWERCANETLEVYRQLAT